MQTDHLIRALGADARQTGPNPVLTWSAAMTASIVAAGVVFTMLCGPRPDLADASQTARFLFKLVVTLSLAGTAFLAARAAARPGAPLVDRLAWVATPVVLLGAAVVVELSVVPSDQWMTRLVGTNSLYCLSFIPAIGLLPLAILIGALRLGAPTHPTLAGAAAGLLAGGIAATFYAVHCFDDSPLFVATWYTLAVAILAVVGAAAGRHFLRW